MYKESTGQRTRRSASHSFYNHDLPSHLGAVVLLFPVIFILWLTESKQQSAKRMRKAGHTYKTIASRLSISTIPPARSALA